MTKVFFTLNFLLIPFFKTQEKDKYIYKIEDCTGLGGVAKIEYNNRNVGTLKGVTASDKFCYGTLYFNHKFSVTKDMIFYKIIPSIGDAYIRIEKLNGKESESRKVKLSTSNNDTIWILNKVK